MTFQLLNFGRARPAGAGVRELRAALTPLVGEPFRLARVSYGDELTLHFGDLRPGASAKVRKLLYGSYILGVCASAWLLKAGGEPVIRAYGLEPGAAPDEGLSVADKRDIEARPFIEPGSHVLAAEPFPARSGDAYGLYLRFSDGGTLVVMPAVPAADPEPADGPGIPDWELTGPDGLLAAGPGPNWSFEPRARPKANDPA